MKFPKKLDLTLNIKDILQGQDFITYEENNKVQHGGNFFIYLDSQHKKEFPSLITKMRLKMEPTMK
jgi:hypothetical protein